MKRINMHSGMENVLVVSFDFDAQSIQNSTPQEQLRGTGYDVALTECFDHVDLILSEGHNTSIILADSILPKKPRHSDQRYFYHKQLICLAKEKGLQGIGIMTDFPEECKPVKKNENGLSIVISESCCKFGIRNWRELFDLVRAQIAKRISGENASGNMGEPGPAKG